MIDEERYIIETNEQEAESSFRRRRIPVLAQLIVVALIFAGLFFGLLWPKLASVFNSTVVSENDDVYIVKKPAEDNEVALQKIDASTVDIKAKSAFVWDVKEQRVLYRKEAEEKLPLASITKLMTTLVAYELVSDQKEVIISETASRQESGGNLQVGEVFEAKDLADFALISSYNSAAYALANSIGDELGEGDSVGQFVAAMNIKSEELGLNNLEFFNPTGLDISETKAGAYGTAKEVSFLVEYILSVYPEILRPTITPNTRLYNKAGDYHDANNTNAIIDRIPNLLGSKTGYTDLAGGNLTVAIDIGFNHPVIITVLGSTINDRFTDVETLIDSVQGLVEVSPDENALNELNN